MWIIRKKNEMFNLDKFQEISVKGNNIQFYPSLNEPNVKITFENEKEAEQSFNYIIEGLKNKNSVIFI